MPFTEQVILDTLKCCGRSNALYYGRSPEKALGAFLAHGVDIQAVVDDPFLADRCNSYFPNRCVYQQGLGGENTPHEAESAAILVVDSILDALSPEEVLAVLINLRCLTTRYAVFTIMASHHGEVWCNREWWEAKCIEAGFRRHPRGQQVCSYDQLNYDDEQFTIFLEIIPDDVLEKYPLSALKCEQEVHMDMLRHATRRSDAYVVQYHMAAMRISPGDTVLDCACGLGYGAHVLYNNSPAKQIIGVDISPSSIQYATDNYGSGDAVTFRESDAQELSFLSDDSVDFITSFGTIEHLSDPDAYLKELARVLRPSGRIMLNAPNEWPLDIGAQSSHCQVYTWDRFRQEVEAHFLLDKGFAQTAGGGRVLPNSLRVWRDVPVEAPLNAEGEWVTLFAMADPLRGRSVPFVETVHTSQPTASDYHATNYAGSYINPWLAKGLTTWPMSNPEQRLKLSERVIKEYPPQSADYGAALCVKAYRILEKEVLAQEVEALLFAIESYQSDADALPHCVRWKISLRYVQGILYQKLGNFEQAEAHFDACSQMNPLEFSAMSSTKVIDACYRAAMMALMRGDVCTARQRLQHSIHAGRQFVASPWFNAIGEEGSPVLFGLHDLAQTLEYLVRSGYALYQLDSWKSRPGLALSFFKGLFERRIESVQAQKESWESGYSRAQRALNEMSVYFAKALAERDGIIAERDRIIAELNVKISARDKGIEELLQFNN